MLFKNLSLVVASLAAFAALASGHPEKVEIVPKAEIHRRQLETNKRHVLAKRCAPQISEFTARRKAKRMLAKRDKDLYARNSGHLGSPGSDKRGPGGPWGKGTATNVVARAVSSAIGSATATANTPTYSTIQNTTCITAPDSEEGPYYVNNEFLRTNIVDNEAGVELLLDMGIMDVATCQPLEQALVEIWHCNATGAYSGFTIPGTGGPGGPGGGGSGMTDQLTFLRGAYPTNSEGMVEFQSVYPGYYDSRAVHIHIMIHTNYSVSTNGTIISHSGQVRNVGRLFFDDALNDQIVDQGVYASNTHSRTYNEDDSVFDIQNANGYDARAQTELIGNTVLDGILGYITVGIDLTRVDSIVSTYYQTASLEDLGL